MTEKEIRNRRNVIEYYRSVAELKAPEKTKQRFLDLADRLEEELDGNQVNI